MYERLVIMRELISEEGSIYIHLDATVGHYVKLILDEVFGPNSFQREIVWRMDGFPGYKSAAKNWIRNHDTILYYVKTPGRFTFNKEEYIPALQAMNVGVVKILMEKVILLKMFGMPIFLLSLI